MFAIEHTCQRSNRKARSGRIKSKIQCAMQHLSFQDKEADKLLATPKNQCRGKEWVWRLYQLNLQVYVVTELTAHEVWSGREHKTISMFNHKYLCIAQFTAFSKAFSFLGVQGSLFSSLISKLKKGRKKRESPAISFQKGFQKVNDSITSLLETSNHFLFDFIPRYLSLFPIIICNFWMKWIFCHAKRKANYQVPFFKTQGINSLLPSTLFLPNSFFIYFFLCKNLFLLLSVHLI